MPANRLLLPLLFIVAIGLIAPPAANARRSTPVTASDSLYSAHHPRLLFDRTDIPALRDKMSAGGPDNDAFAYIKSLVDTVYTIQTVSEVLEFYSFGVGDMPNLGVAAHLSTPADTAARNTGRRLTVYLAENYAPDDNTYYSPLKLRALSLGYDMFFDDATEPDRELVRSEIESYIDTMMTVFNYERWLYRPYVSNLSAMIGSSLGLAAISLADEIDPGLVSAALARADQFVDAWLEHQLDPDGAYSEGAMYAGWSLRNLAYYFAARKRFDGYDYADMPGIRNMERWIAFALLPEGGAKINNINDAAYLNYPLSRHQTYLDWAQTAWGSDLSSWLWEHIAGRQYGHDSGRLADKAATVLWSQPLAERNPGVALPRHILWQHRGLYYFRTGWQDGMSSDDVVFSFYSGKFQGGHAHEDQNNFTLYGYGESFAVDHGYGWTSKESEAHNMVFIDGKGQHYAGGSVGTDGNITEFLMGGYADYLVGDATEAYGTYSEFNRPGFPFPDDDWSYGYDGGNPVDRAIRRAIVVHDTQAPPYFLIFDDIEKDDSLRTYEWRMHTLSDNSVDTTSNPINISGVNGRLDLFVLNPGFALLNKRLLPFDNKEIDPNSTIISLSRTSTRGNFGIMLLPRGELSPQPQFSREEVAWGTAINLEWGGGIDDVILINDGGGNVQYSWQGIDVETDAAIAHIRMNGISPAGYLLSNVSRLVMADRVIIDIPDSRANASLSDTAVHIDRDDVDFVFWAPERDEVFFRESSLAVVHDGDYLRRDWSNDGAGPPRDPVHLRVLTYPNPFNSTAKLFIEIGARTNVRVDIYDAAGRIVKEIWNDTLPRGGNILEWDGTNAHGRYVTTGVYFLKASTGESEQSTKLILLK